MITADQARALVRQRSTLRFHVDGTCETARGPVKVRQNGRVKLWRLAKNAHRFRIPIKYGLYKYGAITENISFYHLEQDCTAPGQQVGGQYRSHAIGCDRAYEHPGGCLIGV